MQKIRLRNNKRSKEIIPLKNLFIDDKIMDIPYVFKSKI